MPWPDEQWGQSWVRRVRQVPQGGEGRRAPEEQPELRAQVLSEVQPGLWRCGPQEGEGERSEVGLVPWICSPPIPGCRLARWEF